MLNNVNICVANHVNMFICFIYIMEKKMKYKFIFNQDTWWREFEENIVSTWLNQLKTDGKMFVDNIFYDKNKNYHLILENFKKQINVVAQ